jgi:membrane protease YdiL (CAAX protease family)
MPTTISEGLRGSHSKHQTISLSLVGTISIGIDFYLAANPFDLSTLLRGLNAGVALAVYIAIVKSPRADLGLQITVENGVHYWLKLGFVLAAIAIILGVAGIAILKLGYLGRAAENIPAVPPYAIYEQFRVMCIESPILEELLYRLIVCVPLAIRSERIAIIGSGLLFAGLHFIYGNPSPENFLGGYFLAWSYLKSGTILVPIAFHAGGNGIALGFQIAAWYVLYE